MYDGSGRQRHALSGPDDRKEQEVKEGGKALETEKGKEMNSKSLQKKNSPANI